MYRKSLRTKDRYLALEKARLLWSDIHRLSFTGEKMNKKKMNTPKMTGDDYEEMIRKSEDDMWEQVERSQQIKIAIKYLDMYESVTDWDEDTRQQVYEYMTPEGIAAIKYCADNDINLDDYRSKKLEPNSTPVNHTNAPSLKAENLDVLLDKFIADHKLEGKSEKTLVTYRGQIRKFVDLFNKSSDELTIEDADFFKFTLKQLPKNRNLKKYRSKTVKQLLDIDIPEPDQPSSKTLKDTTQRVRAFLEWAIRRKYIDPDVLDVLKGVFTTSESNPYSHFSAEDLEKLFFSENYLGENFFNKHCYFWLPLLAVFTGARQGELCQLLVSDLHEFEYKNNTHYYLDINDDGDKTLKTKSSKRKVPLHHMLIKLGFLDYVNFVKNGSTKELFPELLGLTKEPGPTISRWFNETYKQKCGIRDDGKHRKVFHSFRHTLVEYFYQNHPNIPIEKIGDIVGHTHKTITGKSYVGQNNLSLENRMEIISKIDYGVDFLKIRRRIYN